MSDESLNAEQDIPLTEQIDAEQLATGETVANDSESHTEQEAATEEIEQVDVDTLMGSQPDEKPSDNPYIRERIMKRKLKEQKAQLEEQSQNVELDQKPRRSDFLKDDVLYDKFNGSEAQAMAAYEDAVDDWGDTAKTKQSEAETSQASMIDAVTRQIEAEENFEESAESARKVIKGFDGHLDMAERIITPEGALAIKQLYPEDAAYMLAVIGAQPKLGQELATQTDKVQLIKKLTELQIKVKQNAPKAKKISTANAEEAISSSTVNGSLDAKMQKALDAGDTKQYRELKKQAGKTVRYI